MNEFLDINDENFEVFSDYTGIKPLTETQVQQLQEAKKQQDSKGKFDAQKTADTITALGSAGASIFGTVKAFQDPNKVAQRKSLREACGLKPIAGTGKAKYEDCKRNYESAQTFKGTANSGDGGIFNDGSAGNGEGMSTTTKVVLGILALSVVGFIGYKVFKGKTVSA